MTAFPMLSAMQDIIAIKWYHCIIFNYQINHCAHSKQSSIKRTFEPLLLFTNDNISKAKLFASTILLMVCKSKVTFSKFSLLIFLWETSLQLIFGKRGSLDWMFTSTKLK